MFVFKNVSWGLLLTLCFLSTSVESQRNSTICPTATFMQKNKGCQNKAPGLTCIYESTNSTETQTCSYKSTCTCKSSKQFVCDHAAPICAAKSASTSTSTSVSNNTITTCPSYAVFVATNSCPKEGMKCWYSNTTKTSTGSPACLINSACTCNTGLQFDCKVAKTGSDCSKSPISVPATTTTTLNLATTTTQTATTASGTASSTASGTAATIAACPPYKVFAATNSCPKEGMKCWYSNTTKTSTGSPACLINSVCTCNTGLKFDCKVAKTGNSC